MSTKENCRQNSDGGCCKNFLTDLTGCSVTHVVLFIDYFFYTLGARGFLAVNFYDMTTEGVLLSSTSGEAEGKSGSQKRPETVQEKLQAPRVLLLPISEKKSYCWGKFTLFFLLVTLLHVQ